MTLNIMSIVVEEPDDPQSLRGIPGTIDQFWTAAGDVLIELVNRQPDIQKMIDPVVDAGGDIEITAHNRAGRISLTLAGPSGLRHVVFTDAQQWMARPLRQPREKTPRNRARENICRLAVERGPKAGS